MKIDLVVLADLLRDGWSVSFNKGVSRFFWKAPGTERTTGLIYETLSLDILPQGVANFVYQHTGKKLSESRI